MSPDPKTVREIAREYILDDRHRAHDIGPAVLGRFGPDGLTKPEYHAYCDAVRETIRTAQITVSWPHEQQPADVVTAEQQQPSVADADTPVGRIDVWLTAWKRYFGTLGLPFGADLIAGPPPSAEPRVSACDFDVVLEVLAVVLAERARSAAAEQQQDGAVEDVVAFLDAWEAAGLPDTVAHTARGSRDGERPGIYRQKLTVQMLRAVLAEHVALAARVAELESERTEDARAVAAWLAADDEDMSPDYWAATRTVVRARFADRIAALDATETEES